MKKSLLTCTLLLLTLTLAAQTYHLEAVTTIVPNERYVFLQDGDAMSNTLVNKALQTTSDYQTQQLTGSESYVWRLVRKSTAKPLYTLQNCSLDDVSYLSYNTSGLLLTTSSKATQWMLHFQPDGTLVILTKDQNRCLAYTSATLHQYKLYSATLDCTPYDENPGYISVYHLVLPPRQRRPHRRHQHRPPLASRPSPSLRPPRPQTPFSILHSSFSILQGHLHCEWQIGGEIMPCAVLA